MPRPPVIALTGGTGFVGRTVVESLTGQGQQVRALTRRPQPPQSGVTWVEGALDTGAGLNELCRGADRVIHIAGAVNAPDRAGFVAGNVDSTQNMLSAAARAKIGRFVHISSIAATRPDLSVYGWSKAEGETRVRKSSLDWTILRPPAVYGPGDTEMFELFKMAAHGWVLMPPPGRASYIHVGDMARLICRLALAEGLTGAIFEADDGVDNGWSHKAFARQVGAAMGQRAKVVHAPPWAMRLAARGDRLVRGAGAKLTADRVRYMLNPDWVIDPDKRPDPQFWQPEIATDDGLAATAAWYRAQGWLA